MRSNRVLEPKAFLACGLSWVMPAELVALQTKLLEWYALHQRDLPWRKTNDPYKILLSEVLLQQTQVSRGLEYYQHFLRAFPTVQALATAPLEAVLKAWEGAGYYARARNLHQAAQVIVANGMPTSSAGFWALPGVGRYTAGAVSSIALGLPEPVVDGNVRRVLARWLNNANPTDDWLWQKAEMLLAQDQPGNWNQALMELGATVCMPKNPSCASCPVSNYCQAFKQSTVASTPAPKARAKVKEIHAVAIVAGSNGRYVLEQRPKNGLLGGMYGFPIQEISSNDAAALNVLLHRLGLVVAHHLGRVSHTMTHRQFEIEVYGVGLDQGSLVTVADVALAKLDQKMLKLASGAVQAEMF